MVLAPLYFDNEIKLGVISQAFHAFKHVLTDLNIVVNQFESLSLFSAGMDRLGEFADALSILKDPDRVLYNAPEDEIPFTNLSLKISSSFPLVIEGVSIYTPGETRRCLIHNLNVKVQEHQLFIIAGISGSGKSSLLRGMAGLWKHCSGRITRIEEDRTFFLPQRPYCTLGNLREQMTYPSAPLDLQQTDSQLLEVLKQVNLRSLPDRFTAGLDAKKDWSSLLSLGEQQRLAFCRILLNKPELVFLDESTSALDIENEDAMYKIIKDMKMTCISVGNRPNVMKHHDEVLKVRADGSWDVQPIPEAFVTQSHELLNFESIN